MFSKKNHFPLFIISCLLPFYYDAQVINVGNVRSASINGNTVAITTENASAAITVYGANTIRVRLDKKKLSDDFSFAVVGKPLATAAKITQNENTIEIVTDSLKALIAKKPFSITFSTLDGKIINQDETGLTTSWIGEEVTNYKHMQEGERFIGLGEKTGPLDRRGNGYTNWNTDAFGYSSGQDPIYATIPFYIGIHNNLNYGIFFDNSYQSDFNFGSSNNRFSSFSARGGEMDYYFIYHKNIADIITSYTQLTGRMTMPPIWSLGYQQNRYSYYPETEVLRIAQTLREKKIPADGITLDIHYMDAYKLFTWNKERFPNPKKLTDQLNTMGFKTTVIVDPGIKVEKGYKVYESGLKENIFLKYSDGDNYTGQVWPGWCHFPDFTSTKGRNWWKNEIKTYAADGVAGIWNDMNEIATWGQKMPNNILFDFEGKTTTHQEGRNVYGFQMARASFEGYKAALGNKRPFNLTRAGFAGLQRYTAIWTGDNRSEDDHMLAGVRLLSSLGLSGVPFTGMDVGGFTGNPSVNLFIRWMQIGAFTPYFRNHTAVNTPSAEPWTHGEEALEISRNYVNLRYRLMPYLYSAFYEASQNGLPIVRSLAIDNTFDSKVYDGQFQNQYLFGKAFMITPVTGYANFVKIYFPKNNWYNLYTGELEYENTEKNVELSIKKLPIYVRESSIYPMQSLIQSTSEKPTDTLIVHIYKGNINNTYVYYEDDGESYNYEKNDYYKRTINYDAAKKSIAFEAVTGNFKTKFNYLKVMMHGFNSDNNFKMNDKVIELKSDYAWFLSPISVFDPLGSSGKPEGYNVKSVVVKNDTAKFTLSY